LSSAEKFREGDRFEAEIILIGHAIRYIPYVIYGWEKFGSAGIGKGRGRFSVERVLAQVGPEWQEIYSGQSHTLVRRRWETMAPELDDVMQSNAVRSLEINLLTPLRIKFGGALSNSFEFHIFLTNIVRRICLLHRYHCEGRPGFNYADLLADSRTVSTTIEDLRWMDWSRYSARQQTELKMGGLVGKIKIAGDLSPFVPYLKVGELVHVGKGTSMGMGMFTITSLPGAANP